ncbi:hypothetical protein AGMMS49579_01000 [Spirochaetia bacterium]|nr:hypothetical protein AGMMS49579_01000 [Spirochaetia bacterium]
MNIFLDLDNTLVSVEPLNEVKDLTKFKERASKFNYKNIDNYYLACGRPFLQQFLEYLSKNHKIHIWTAASKDYALFIVAKFIYPKKVKMILYDKHCKQSIRKYKTRKQLDMLWDVWKLPEYNINNTILIDDLKDVALTQPNNVLLTKEFNFLEENSEKDKDLLRLINKIKNIKI